MSRALSKREFLKLMGGLSLGLLPFIGCYESGSDKKTTNKSAPDDGGETSLDENKYANVTNNDVVMLTKSDELFETYKHGYNKRIEKMPRKIAVCYTELGIQYAIFIAKKEKLPIAICSGGHSFEGFSSNNDGMVINLSNMNKISWEEDDTVSIGPGCTVAQLHAEVFSKGKMVPAGSCGGVAMGGLTLGGGYGFFSRKYGLSCDAMQDARIVLASEDVVEASSKDDLLWALRGAGNGNFGVVSQLRYKANPLPPSFTAYTLKFRKLDLERFEQAISTFFTQTKQLPQEAFGAFVLNGSTLTILITTYGSQDIKPIIAPLIALSDTNSESLKKPTVAAMKRFYGRKDPLFFKNSSAGYYKDYNDISSISAAIFEKIVSNSGMIFQINTLGGAINDISPETSCYPHRDMNYLAELQGYYDSPKDTGRITAAFQEIQQLVADAGITAQYRNYPDINFKNWQEAYYGANYAKLQALKNKLDPDNIFTYPQAIIANG